MNKRIMAVVVSLQIVARSACMQCNELTIFKPQQFSNVTLINGSQPFPTSLIPIEQMEALPTPDKGDFFSIFEDDEADRLELIPRKSSFIVQSAVLIVLFLTITGAICARIVPAAHQ